MQVDGEGPGRDPAPGTRPWVPGPRRRYRPCPQGPSAPGGRGPYLRGQVPHAGQRVALRLPRAHRAPPGRRGEQERPSRAAQPRQYGRPPRATQPRQHESREGPGELRMVTTAFLTDPECYPGWLTGQRQPAYSSPRGPDRLTAPAALPAPSIRSGPAARLRRSRRSASAPPHTSPCAARTSGRASTPNDPWEHVPTRPGPAHRASRAASPLPQTGPQPGPPGPAGRREPGPLATSDSPPGAGGRCPSGTVSMTG